MGHICWRVWDKEQSAKRASKDVSGGLELFRDSMKHKITLMTTKAGEGDPKREGTPCTMRSISCIGTTHYAVSLDHSRLF